MTDPIDTARQEGIALGLAMAKASIYAERTKDTGMYPGEAALYRDGLDDALIVINRIQSIPPYVAAVRVLLDVMDPAIWRSAIAAMEPILRADIQPTAWNSEDEIMAALTAALEQIAKGEG